MMNRIDVREWNDYDGTTNLQDAFDFGQPLLVGEGHRVDYEDRYIGVSSGLDLEVRGEIRKAGAPNSGGITGSLFRNKSFDEKVTGVRIRGTGMDTPGGIVGAVDHTKTANVIGLYGDDILIEGVVTDCWAGGRYMVIDGDDNVVRWNKAYGSPKETNNGGVRQVGGRNFQCYGNDIWSGDDTYQCVPDGSGPQSPTYDHSISGTRYHHNTGGSYDARAMVVVTQNRDHDPAVLDMTCSVSDVWFTENNVVAGRAGVVVQNINSTGEINGVWFVGGSIDCGQGDAPHYGQEVLVNGNPASGGVRNVYAHRAAILNKRARNYTRTAGKTENINLDGFRAA